MKKLKKFADLTPAQQNDLRKSFTENFGVTGSDSEVAIYYRRRQEAAAEELVQKFYKRQEKRNRQLLNY